MFPICASAGLIFDAPLATAVNFANGGTSYCSTGLATTIVSGFHISTDGAACFPSAWGFLDFGLGRPPDFGFAENTPNIAYLQIGGDYIALADLAVSGPAAPEPATTVTAGLAFALVILLRGLTVRRDKELSKSRQLAGNHMEEVISDINI